MSLSFPGLDWQRVRGLSACWRLSGRHQPHRLLQVEPLRRPGPDQESGELNHAQRPQTRSIPTTTQRSVSPWFLTEYSTILVLENMLLDTFFVVQIPYLRVNLLV